MNSLAKATIIAGLFSVNAISLLKAIDYLGFEKYYQAYPWYILIANLIIIGIVLKYWEKI